MLIVVERRETFHYYYPMGVHPPGDLTVTYEQGYDNEISFLHAYVDVNDKNIFYYVDCSVIQDYGQVETFDNEHTVYERIKVGTADATLGTNNSGGRTGYVLVWEKDGISHTIIGKIPREEILKIAESIS